MPRPEVPHRVTSKSWIWLPVVVAGLWFAYVLVANLAFRSAILRRVINKKPDRFFLDWRSVTTWFPGFFRVKGLRFVGQGTRSLYYGEVDEARFRVRLAPLFRREIRVADFEAVGIVFRLRRPDPTDGPAPVAQAFHPPIPGLESLPRRTAPRSGRGTPSWRIRADSVRLRDVRQVWLYADRLDGPGDLQAALDMQVEGPFRVEARKLAFPAATLTHNGETAATNLAIELRGWMGPLVFDVDDVPDERILEFIGAHLKLKGDLRTLALLSERLGTHRSVQFGGGGRIDADLRIERGRWQTGSAVDLRSPELRVNVAGLEFGGDALLEDRVEVRDGEPLAGLTMRLRDLRVRQDGRIIGSADGPALELTSRARDLALTRSFADADLGFRLGPVVVPDASFLNQYLPAGTNLAIVGGAIRVEADLRAPPGASPGGHLNLHGDALAARVRGLDYGLSLTLKAKLSESDEGRDRLRLDGTELVITNVVLPKIPSDRQEGWHARIGIDEGRLRATHDWRLDARVSLDLRDTRPILAILEEREGAPGWLKLVPTLRDIRGATGIEAASGSMRLSGLALDGRSLEVLGEMLLGSRGFRGIAYARYGVVSAGLDFRDAGRTRWRILGAKRWYQEALTSPLTPPGEAEPEVAEEPEARDAVSPDPRE